MKESDTTVQNKISLSIELRRIYQEKHPIVGKMKSGISENLYLNKKIS